ncbi:MAG TPA: tetratricopeptide repeat protein [Polyangia bacterium]|nr:tetratricopeptide repeat protein [Polyangia bacterium]
MLALGPGCRRIADRPRASLAPPVQPAPATPSGVVPSVALSPPPAGVEAMSEAAPDGKSSHETPPRPLHRCFPDRPSWIDAPVADLLDRAGELFDASDFDGALACAEEAARQAPRSVEAHHNRAVAFMHLDRLDDARDAMALALALNPLDPETLEAAADLNINQLPPSADRSAIGLEYARRGSRHVSRRDPDRAARLALLEGQALIDLGRAAEALRRIDAALAVTPKLAAAQYERGVALFELCRFAEAQRMFEKVLVSSPEHSHALYHLGLIAERMGDDAEAVHRLSEAHAQDPKAFPQPPDVSATDFAERVRRAVAALPAEVQGDLAQIQVQTADIPLLEDLIAERPPLSPTILGLFRGLPLGWSDEEPRVVQAVRAGNSRRAPAQSPPEATPDRDGAHCAVPERAVVLYRRNLLRTVHDSAELDQAITRTLLHEAGHLRGEDDGSLRDRGLE